MMAARFSSWRPLGFLAFFPGWLLLRLAVLGFVLPFGGLFLGSSVLPLPAETVPPFPIFLAAEPWLPGAFLITEPCAVWLLFRGLLAFSLPLSNWLLWANLRVSPLLLGKACELVPPLLLLLLGKLASLSSFVSASYLFLLSASATPYLDLQNTSFTVQLGGGASIQLTNALINTGNIRATIQFGSVDFPAIIARTAAIPANGRNAERLSRRLNTTEAPTRRAHLSKDWLERKYQKEELTLSYNVLAHPRKESTRVVTSSPVPPTEEKRNENKPIQEDQWEAVVSKKTIKMLKQLEGVPGVK
ncbi:hypothetical protein M5K25_006824 [Dendrobium thyrsiflorum]|uniref:Uncharacterized protein n=1 Tax=Dendrobium thyrsiflorum TaxID=117978 RepID=A0ABD0VC46_DENTH